MRKLLDKRINDLIRGVCSEGHRGLFVIIGDNGKDQLPVLHSLLCRSRETKSTAILWCYKKHLELSSNAKKRRKQIRKKVKLGKQDEHDEDAFEMFLSSNDVTYALYRDSQRVLGRTFAMCVLQDFEALTPNLLAQTVETVAGRGLVVILLSKMSSLKQLSAMAMDVHSRFRKDGEEAKQIRSRFNERFTLSLTRCGNCLVVDDELNVLPISSQKYTLRPDKDQTAAHKRAASELRSLQEEMKDSKPICHLTNLCRTLDQAKAFLGFVGPMIDKSNALFCMTAPRGRGKTFLCGLFIAYSLEMANLTNVYVTSPYPQNIEPLFASLRSSLEAMGYSEHRDYESVRSTKSEDGKSVVRFNVFRGTSRFVQYIPPGESDVIAKSQPQLLVIDEAAAIPLPLTKALLRACCPTVLSSTTSGYEGTGRSLTLKLIRSLRELTATTSFASHKTASLAATAGGKSSRKKSHSRVQRDDTRPIVASPRPLVEVSLEEPIRYSPGDAVEIWLAKLLCLDSPLEEHSFLGTAPHPASCGLFLVDRDALFSGHKASESFLARVMSLYVSSHYKNSPNDLQLLSDAPSHRIFALLADFPSSAPNDGREPRELIPRVACVLQVAFEGDLSDDIVQKGFRERVQAAGDLIPWTLSTQYQERSFASLSGVRIVRIATHPELQGMGYGSRAVSLLASLFEKESPAESAGGTGASAELTGEKGTGANFEAPSDELAPPLFTHCDELFFGKIDWIGTSFGLTRSLFNFWSKNGFHAVYLRQSSNKLTGEHSCIMLKKIGAAPAGNVRSIEFFQGEFLSRFLSLLSFGFSGFPVSLALSLVTCSYLAPGEPDSAGSAAVINSFLTKNDINRLSAYSQNLVDFTTVVDLVPKLSELFFKGHFPELSFSFVQKGIFVAVGLQRRSLEDLADELDLNISQVLGLFNKAIRKIVKKLEKLGSA